MYRCTYYLFSMYTTNISEFNIFYISIFMYLGLMKLDFDMTGIVLFPFVFFFYIKYWYILCLSSLLQVVFCAPGWSVVLIAVVV